MNRRDFLRLSVFASIGFIFKKPEAIAAPAPVVYSFPLVMKPPDWPVGDWKLSEIEAALRANNWDVFSSYQRQRVAAVMGAPREVLAGQNPMQPGYQITTDTLEYIRNQTAARIEHWKFDRGLFRPTNEILEA